MKVELITDWGLDTEETQVVEIEPHELYDTLVAHLGEEQESYDLTDDDRPIVESVLYPGRAAIHP